MEPPLRGTKVAYFKIEGLRTNKISKALKFSIYPPIVKPNSLLGRPTCKE